MPRISKNREEKPAERLARYQRIVQAFEYAGLANSQAAIGSQLKPAIGQGGVSAWKKSNPSLGHLVQIIRLTGVNGHWLLLGEGPIAPCDELADADQFMRNIVEALPPEAQKAIVDRVRSNRKTQKKKR